MYKSVLPPWKKSGSNVVLRDLDADVGIGLSSGLKGKLDIDTGDNRWLVLEISLANDASVVLSDILPSGVGLVWVFGTDSSAPTDPSTGSAVFGCFSMEGDDDSMTQAFDLKNNIQLGADSGTNLCVTDGGGEYTMVNRLDYNADISIMFMGY